MADAFANMEEGRGLASFLVLVLLLSYLNPKTVYES